MALEVPQKPGQFPHFLFFRPGKRWFLCTCELSFFQVNFNPFKTWTVSGRISPSTKNDSETSWKCLEKASRKEGKNCLNIFATFGVHSDMSIPWPKSCKWYSRASNRLMLSCRQYKSPSNSMSSAKSSLKCIWINTSKMYPSPDSRISNFPSRLSMLVTRLSRFVFCSCNFCCDKGRRLSSDRQTISFLTAWLRSITAAMDLSIFSSAPANRLLWTYR